MGWEDPLEEGMTTHSSILAWEIAWTEEPGGLQSMGLQRVRHDRVTKHAHTLLIKAAAIGGGPSLLPAKRFLVVHGYEQNTRESDEHQRYVRSRVYETPLPQREGESQPASTKRPRYGVR